MFLVKFWSFYGQFECNTIELTSEVDLCIIFSHFRKVFTMESEMF